MPDFNKPFTVEVVFLKEIDSKSFIIQNSPKMTGATTNLMWIDAGGKHAARSRSSLDTSNSDLVIPEMKFNQKIYSSITINSSGKKFYYTKGDELLSTSNGVSGTETWGANWFIGCNGTNLENPLMGNIYAVRIYDRELTEEEIRYNYTIDNDRFGLGSRNTKVDLGYINDGLMVHYDGVQNIGNGHSNTARYWEDISGNSRDATLFELGTTWESNALKITSEGGGAKINNMPDRDGPITIEVVALRDMNIYGAGYFIRNGIETTPDRASINMLYCEPGNRQYILNARSSTETTENLTVSMGFNEIIYAGMTLGTNSKILYYDVGSGLENMTNDSVTLSTIGDGWYVGNRPHKDRGGIGKIYAVRIYDRALSEEEIKHNYEVDKARYGIERKQVVPAIISNGTQYIDTGVQVDSTISTFEIETCERMKTLTDRNNIEGITDSYKFFMGAYRNNYFCVSGTSANGQAIYTMVDEKYHVYKHSLTNKNNIISTKFFIDDMLVYTNSYTWTSATPKNYWLFHTNSNSAPNLLLGKVTEKVWAKIKLNGELVRDFVAVEEGDTTYSTTPAPSNCMWDKVTGQYYENENKANSDFGITK